MAKQIHWSGGRRVGAQEPSAIIPIGSGPGAEGLPPPAPTPPAAPEPGGEHHARPSARFRESGNPAGLRAHQNASLPLLAHNAEGLCPKRQVALQASCPPLPSFPRCGQTSVFTGTQPLSPRKSSLPPQLLSLLSPFPRAHAQPEPRAHIPGSAGAPVSCGTRLERTTRTRIRKTQW